MSVQVFERVCVRGRRSLMSHLMRMMGNFYAQLILKGKEEQANG